MSTETDLRNHLRTAMKGDPDWRVLSAMAAYEKQMEAGLIREFHEDKWAYNHWMRTVWRPLHRASAKPEDAVISVKERTNDGQTIDVSVAAINATRSERRLHLRQRAEGVEQDITAGNQLYFMWTGPPYNDSSLDEVWPWGDVGRSAIAS